jgi:hypothetical protein
MDCDWLRGRLLERGGGRRRVRRQRAFEIRNSDPDDSLRLAFHVQRHLSLVVWFYLSAAGFLVGSLARWVYQEILRRQIERRGSEPK